MEFIRKRILTNSATDMAKTTDNYWVGFDLGGTKMLAAVFDDELNLITRQRKKTKGHEGSEMGLARIAATIRKALTDADIETSQLAGIGVGCAGPLDLERGIIHEAPNLGWKDVHVQDYLKREFDCPVSVINDVDAGVFGEYRFGAAMGSRSVVGVFPGTGIGGGCVYEGKIIQGANTSCMEIGHIPVMPEGPMCGCGQSGCLEAVASRLAISSAAAQAAYRGQAPELLKTAGTDISNIRSGALADSIRAGDKVVENIVRAAAQKIGSAVVTVVHLIAPDKVVLGGGLVEALPDLFVEEVAAAAKKRVLPSFVDSFQVVAAKLGDDAAVMGTAAWARDRFSLSSVG